MVYTLKWRQDTTHIVSEVYVIVQMCHCHTLVAHIFLNRPQKGAVPSTLRITAIYIWERKKRGVETFVNELMRIKASLICQAYIVLIRVLLMFLLRDKFSYSYILSVSNSPCLSGFVSLLRSEMIKKIRLCEIT